MSTGELIRWAIFSFALGFIFGAMLYIASAQARDLGQWENTDPVVKEWFKSLMMPDNPTIPCCGESDAYYCDTINVKEGKTYCTITDDRDDVPLRRPHINIGTVIEIPDYKLKWDKGNPVGHAIAFLTPGHIVLCFVQNSGT